MPLDFYDSPTCPPEDDAGRDPGRRLYISILFECCDVYDRIYRRPDERHYAGRCPKCLRAVRVRVGPEGTHSRLFRAS